MLKFEELHIGFAQKKHSEQRILFEVDSMSFKPGDFVAVIGPNGSGKTTLFNSILGHQEILSGAINIDGENWSNLNRIEKSKYLSFVPSKFDGVDHLSVFDLVAMGRAPYTNLLNKLTKDDQLVVQKVIDQLGLSKFADKNTLNLSDGERQIAMIGKALAQDAKIMILDEPTAFLDYINRRKVLQLLKEIAQLNDQIVFISSHDLDLCFEYCNRIIAIDTNSKKLLQFIEPFHKNDVIQTIFE
ncbi:ABC transporter ATP-binding protein [Brumimicrobium mesophilum]|uniref:ABC transporter ATP-binding protein n=1 Tax=Brumimicrobium mesophilum TaxID=392717 RepID=UPI00131E1B1D|nr:ABC transporter ATP-binding protein [Brumimicrobium mesophilum]